MPRPIPPIKPVKNLTVLLLFLKTRYWVRPSINVGKIIKNPNIKRLRLKPQLKINTRPIIVKLPKYNPVHRAHTGNLWPFI
jgi:hypothetical protein